MGFGGDFGEEFLRFGFESGDGVGIALYAFDADGEVFGQAGVVADEVAPLPSGAGHLPLHLGVVLRFGAAAADEGEVGGGVGAFDFD